MPPQKRKAARKPIVLTLTAKQRADLQARGLLKKGRSNWARVTYRNGKVILSRHLVRGQKLGSRAQFVSSNSAFA